jgi:gluconokinase
MALTIGTSAALRVVHADEPGAPVAVPLPLWCYRLDARRRVSGGALSNGGIVAAFLAELLRLPDATAWDDALAAREAAGHGLVVLPALLGERTPGGRARAPAAVVGATADTDALDVLHASLEAVAYNVAGLFDTLRGIFPQAQQLFASGGALYASRTWTQIVADALGQPLALVAEKETTSRGAALVALERLGAIGSLEDAPPPEAVEFRPDAARHARHERAAARQRELESLLTPWWASAGETARNF